MKRIISVLLAAVAVLALVLAWQLKAGPADEIARLADLMGWKQGSMVADIGAGDGSYSFAAAERVGPSGKVFATEIDLKKIKEIRSEVKRRHLQNVEVIESAEADTKYSSS